MFSPIWIVRRGFWVAFLRNLFLLFVLTGMIGGCSSKARENIIDKEVENLRNSLNNISGKYILFGHQDDLAYGLGWKGIRGNSDVKSATGDYPALFGWELGNIGDFENIDGIPFDSIVSYIKLAHTLGGVNTISWHARYPVTNFNSWNLTDIDVQSILPGGDNHGLFLEKLNLLAGFFHRLKTPEGKPIPVIFRPWHEMYGNWFWWGRSKCSDDDYIQLFRYTVDYLKNEKKVSNLLIAFSPDNRFNSEDTYLERYPGDEYVDVLGLDDYGDFRSGRLDLVVIKLGIVSDIAKKKNKIAAFTETGSDKLEINNWYTSNLLQVLKANDKTRNMAWVMVWRNRDSEHFYVPNGQHPQQEDFRLFCDDKMIILLDEYKRLK
ncbi:MAG: beta-mannosidase [Prolixibacteraceae bacterium]|nr:beta-mannosidase [Prolixibacteraceae bacterium]